MQRGYVEGYTEGYVEGLYGEGTWRGYVAGVHRVLPLATIDLVGDNREPGSFRIFLRFYTHYGWLIVSEH